MSNKNTKFRIRSFFRQFKFLANIRTGEERIRSSQPCRHPGCQETATHHHPTFLSITETERVVVSRVSPELLEQRAWTRGASGSKVDICDQTRFFLLDERGDLLVEVAESVDVRHHEAHTDDEHREEETVGEALLHLSDPGEVRYVVRLHTGYTVENHQSVGGCEITVYKPPIGFTLKDWIDEQLRREQARLAGAIAEIDAEASA